MNKFDCIHTRFIVCPHCGYVDHDLGEYDFESGDIEVECGTCDETFTVSQYVEVTHSTRRKEDNN